MQTLVPIQRFVDETIKLVETKCGYIMGSYGQNPRTGYIDLSIPESKCKSSWKTTGHMYTQYSGRQKEKALYWRKNAPRVSDCNGIAEFVYEYVTGVCVNSKARYNYRDWCDDAHKGKGMIPAKLRVPGAAVFWSDSGAGSIHHVGYLIKPVDKNHPEGDWIIAEARGVMYGCVYTKLYSRKPNYYGWMTKLYDYSIYDEKTNDGDNTVVVAPIRPVLRNGSEGSAVKTLQSMLIELGYDLGKWGADGDFGDATELAVEAFQRANDLDVDGIVGEKTWTALEDEFAEVNKQPTEPAYVLISGGKCWIHTEPNTEVSTRIAVAHEGDKLPYIETDDETRWYKVEYKGKEAFVSFKYAKLVV